MLNLTPLSSQSSSCSKIFLISHLVGLLCSTTFITAVAAQTNDHTSFKNLEAETFQPPTPNLTSNWLPHSSELASPADIQNNDLTGPHLPFTPTQSPEESIPAEVGNSYCNSRFGFCIGPIDSRLIPQGESDNRDGQSFEFIRDNGKNPAIKLLAYGFQLDPDLPSTCKANEVYGSLGKPSKTLKKINSTTTTHRGKNPNGLLYDAKAVRNQNICAVVLFEYEPSEERTVEAMKNKLNLTFPQ